MLRLRVVYDDHRLSIVEERLAAVYAAGPLATTVLLLGACAALSNATRRELSPAQAFALVNGFLLFTSIIPFRSAADIGTPKNDLTQLLGTRSVSEQHLDMLAAGSCTIEFSQLHMLGDYEAAYQEATRILALEPADWMLRARLAELLIFAEIYPEAAEHYASVLNDKSHPEGTMCRRCALS